MKELQKELKSGKLKNIYLLYGEERYLVKTYEKLIREKVMDAAAEMMNLNKFEGKNFTVAAVHELSETQPFMSEYRLILMEDTKLFVTGRKDDSEKMIKVLEALPESTIMVFCEAEADKRGKLYKKLAELGRAVEFKTPPEKEYITWVIRVLGKLGKSVTPADAAYLIRTVGGEMETVRQECEKLSSYTADRPDNNITRKDIDEICVKSLESKIFSLTAAIGNKDPKEALNIYANLLIMKESPIMILTMAARQIRLILECKLAAARGLSSNDTASLLGLRSFIVSECLRQSKNFEKEPLIRALEDCLETDVSIKTGRIGDKLGVEMLIAQLCRR